MRTYQLNLITNLTRWINRRSRKISEGQLQSGLILLNLDLEPARIYLEALYSPNRRGRPHYDPVCMLRALILMLLLGFKSITSWAKELRTKPRLAIMADFATNTKEKFNTPSVGCFYQFIDRLIDGKYQKPCQHYVRPSKMKKGKHLRNIPNEREDRKKRKGSDISQYDSLTKKLKDQLIADEDKSRPEDLLKRLEDILISCAIIPSQEKGLLGDTSNLEVFGDGSALPSNANPNGRPACNCHEEGIGKCDHHRYYSDATANWGYDSYRNSFYFGHYYYQHVVNHNGHDLPLHVSIANANETDFTLSMKDLHRLKKALKEHGLNWKISHAVYDAGHDALGNYEYLTESNIIPVIALNPRKGVNPSASGTAEMVNEEGVPICPAGMLMRFHGYIKNKHRIIYNCPVKRPTHKDGQHLWNAFPEECPNNALCDADTKMGPVVYVKTSDDPRLYPPLPRSSAKFSELMSKRSCCERSNSVKKVTYRLGERPCRSQAHFLVRLYLVSIIEHAKAWFADEMELVNGDPLALISKFKARFKG